MTSEAAMTNEADLHLGLHHLLIFFYSAMAVYEAIVYHNRINFGIESLTFHNCLNFGKENSDFAQHRVLL